MATERVVDHLQGVCIPSEQITIGTLKARGAGATDSSYTEQGPKAGQPAQPDGQDSDLVLLAKGDQSQEGHLELLTRRSGHPMPEHGAFVFRDVDAGDSVSEYKGHDVYCAVTGWDPIVYDDATNFLEPHMNVIRLESGKLLATGFVDSGGNYEVREYDPTTSTWGPGINIGPQDAVNVRQSCLVQLSRRYDDATEPRVLLFLLSPDGRQIDVYRSDDDGGTWALDGDRVCVEAILDSGGTPPTVYKMQAAYNNRQILLALDYLDGSSGAYTIQQWASSDDGGTLTLAATTSGAHYVNPSVVAVPGGGFVVSCWDNSTAPAGWRSYRTPTAWDAFSGGVNALIDAMTLNTLLTGCMWMDEDGVLYALTTSLNTGNTRYEMHMARSLDNAASWEQFNLQPWTFEDQANHIWKFDCASTFGRAAVVTRWAADPVRGFEGDSVACVWLGGYSSHTLPDSSSDLDEAFEEVNFLGWGDNVNAAGEAGLWLPIQRPGNVGWATFGAGTGSNVLNNPTGELHVNTAIGQDEDFVRTSSSLQEKVMATFQLRVPSGGNKAAAEISVLLRLARNASAFDVAVELRFDSTGFRVYDTNGGAAVGADVALDMTTAKWIRVSLERSASAGNGQVRVWSCSDAHVREWTEERDGTVTDALATANPNQVIWGHQAAAANDSYWGPVGYNFRVNAWSAHPSWWSIFGTNWSNPDALHPRSHSTEWIGLLDDVMIRAESGPTKLGETWDIEQTADYPARNLDVRQSASPSQPWRSVGIAAQVAFVWDMEPAFTDEGFLDNASIGAFIFGANFKTAEVEGYNGAAWVTIASLDASDGFTSLGFTRKGRKLKPSGGTAKGDRYLFNESHVGDTFDLGAIGGEGAARYVKIEHNTEGAWRRSETKQPTVTLENDDLNGNEVSSGTGAIWRRNFGAIIGAYAAAYDQIRVRIPVQATADGDFRGTIVIGHIAVLGQVYDSGYSRVQMIPQVVNTRPSGNRSARAIGSPAREIDFALVAGAGDVTPFNAFEPDPDYRRTASSGDAASAIGDVVRMLEGVLRRTNGAEVPVVMLTGIEYQTGGATVQLENRPECMILGRFITDLHVVTPLGDEGVDELEQYQTITFAEEV